jgi:hypothetical protein
LCEVRSFIYLYILHMNIMCWKHSWHMDECVDRWSRNLWMNDCHMNFAFSYKSMCQMCFQCMMLMLETYKLWMNEFCTISIIKSWNVKFVMMCTIFLTINFLYQSKMRTKASLVLNLDHETRKTKHEHDMHKIRIQ